MDIRFKNAKIAAFCDGLSQVTEGEIHVSDDVISYVGPKPDVPIAFDREIDCHGNLLLPAFKNAHTHSGMTFLRSFADDLPLQTWLTEKVFPFEAQLTPDDVNVLSRLAILEYLSSGMSTNFDMYYNRDAIADASISLGFRTVLMGAANDFGGTAAEMEREYKKFNVLHPRISYRMGFHAEYTTSLPLMQDIAAMTRQYKEPLFAHIAETKAEVEGCVSRYGMRPLALLDSLGMFAYGGGGFHCVHVSEQEMEIMQRRGLYAVTCPGSNTKLASGIAPIHEYLERGIPVAIGTDGPASNNCLDMFREMFLVTGLQKLLHGADAVDAIDVLRMACCNGARCLGIPDCDSLAPGKQADIVMIDLDRPNMQPVNDVLKNVVYSGSKENVKMTMVAGRVLYENGAFFVNDDPERIYRAANAVINRMR